MIRVGIVSFDTSHVVQFTRRLNHVGIEEEQWVDGAQIVAFIEAAAKSAQFQGRRTPLFE